jgi:hypothetical protein
MPFPSLTQKNLCRGAIVVLLVIIAVLAYYYKEGKNCPVCNLDNCECPECQGCSNEKYSAHSSLPVRDVSADFPKTTPLDNLTLQGAKNDGYITMPGEDLSYKVNRGESIVTGGFHGPLNHSATDLSVFAGVL